MKSFLWKSFFSLVLFTFSFLGSFSFIQAQVNPEEDLQNQESEVFVNFPGWSMVVYQQTPSGQYYPYIKSNGALDRTPASETLYLMLENKLTGQLSVLDTYPGGYSSFHITWPPFVPDTGSLAPGGSYAIFLSNNQVDQVLYEGVNPYYDIPGVVPETNEEDPIPDDNNSDPGDGDEGYSGGTSPIQPIEYNETQQDVLTTGIVSQKCGYNLGKGESGRMCGFSDLIILIQRVIEYIFILVLPIMALVIAYTGYLYLTSGGNKNQKDKAKNAIVKSFTGIVFIMAAWLIVRTIVVSLGVDPGQPWFYLG